MGWTFDHFDSHFPWKQHQLTERDARAGIRSADGRGFEKADGSRSVNWLLLVKPNGDPVYEQRQT